MITTQPDGTATVASRCLVLLARPTITPEIAAAEAQKLLPHPRIATVPNTFTLVNIETPLWIATAPEIDLGTVTLLGHRVGIRAHLQNVDWDFGDGISTTSDGAGRAYSDDDPCTTVDCPQYYGHTYWHSGRPTVAAGLTWTGEFRVDGGGWQQIAGTVTAAATNLRVSVREARGVLVPNAPR